MRRGPQRPCREEQPVVPRRCVLSFCLLISDSPCRSAASAVRWVRLGATRTSEIQLEPDRFGSAGTRVSPSRTSPECAATFGAAAEKRRRRSLDDMTSCPCLCPHTARPHKVASYPTVSSRRPPN
ncbi:Hypothetical protein SMAX5B_001383 [Scophthalmus maximus]|uniref:Uncharacterized protein n=1 Tax=Scophthalmus maximus TaxID=52904 RepID=A0A2U9CP06_SCOMX|nr:Hypothetical protein SMAX5B_001383 [Scophthalmus maximus]KAF0032189.1 hypothetical protein F2P81_014479 [Scophthalmus maximus]